MKKELEIEHGSCSPLTFSTAGGWGPIATTVYKRIAFLAAIQTVFFFTLLSDHVPSRDQIFSFPLRIPLACAESKAH